MIITFDDLVSIHEKHSGKKLVLTSGTFDLFHVGHLCYLEQVKSYGDIVVVLLSGDGRVKARKGPSRPIISEHDRAQILDALAIVDYVFIDPSALRPDQIDPIHSKIVSRLMPDLYVTDGEDPRFWSTMNKDKLVVLPRADGGNHASTSAIVEYISRLAN